MLSIPIKTTQELASQRHAGKLLASVFDMLDSFIQPGVSTMAINNRVEDFIVNDLHSRPASKGQYDFPYVLNTSINEVVCHGMPKESELLKSGTIVNVDITLEKEGLIADSSKMYLIGEVSPLARRLVQKTYEAMWKGIKVVRRGRRWAISAMRSRLMLKVMATAWSGSTAATALAERCMKIRRCYITANPAPAPCSRRGWCLPLNRWLIRAIAE